MGWQPFSFKKPGTDEWISYRDWEPFATMMGLTADAIYEGQRVDGDWTQETLNKISWSIGANITGKQFISGL